MRTALYHVVFHEACPFQEMSGASNKISKEGCVVVNL